MEKHPIESLMGTSMENIKDMVDVNTVVGDPVMAQDGSTIIPISRVSFGFVAGGGEYALTGAQTGAYGLPFAGGAGGPSPRIVDTVVVDYAAVGSVPARWAS